MVGLKRASITGENSVRKRLAAVGAKITARSSPAAGVHVAGLSTLGKLKHNLQWERPAVNFTVTTVVY